MIIAPKGMSFVPSAQVHGRTFTSPDGWFTAERINLPLEGSLHFTYRTTDKAGKVMYYYGYVSGRVHRVTLLAPTKSAVEPPLFRRAVVSVRWLKEP